jgi:hypothetical protein
MKNLFIIVTLFLFGFTSSAQISFNKGDIEFATGIGIFSTFAKDNATTVVPPVSARLGVRLAPNFSLAAYAAYSEAEVIGQEQPDGSIIDLKNEFTQVGLRAAVHGSPNDKLDFYGGAMLGYNMPNVTEFSDGQVKSKSDDVPSFSRPAENNFTYSAFIGAAYYPFKRAGLFAEVGYGVSILSTGFTFKF